ncbi:MAG: DNA polymerase-3 subunit delta [Candidatus Midichloriaceae bacterium]|jgi:DNA polymerase-3 subunit delta
MNFSEFENYISKDLKCFDYMFVGDDIGQITHCTDALLKKYTKGESYFTDKLSYPDLQKDNSLLKGSLGSLSLFDDKKIVIIDNLTNTLSKEVLDILHDKKNDFLLIIKAKGIKKSSKTYKSLSSNKRIMVVNCYQLEILEINRFIEKILKAHCITYTREILSVISHILPSDIMIIKNELDKLILYMGDDTELTLEIIKKVIAGERNSSYVNLCHAIIFKNKNKLFEQLKILMDERKNPIGILRILQNYFARILYIKKEEYCKKISVLEAINSLRPPVFFKEKNSLLEICNKITYSNSLKILNELVSLEIKLKNLHIDQNTVFYNYLLHKV